MSIHSSTILKVPGKVFDSWDNGDNSELEVSVAGFANRPEMGSSITKSDKFYGVHRKVQYQSFS